MSALIDPVGRNRIAANVREWNGPAVLLPRQLFTAWHLIQPSLSNAAGTWRSAYL
jgi:hypothetical protein